METPDPEQQSSIWEEFADMDDEERRRQIRRQMSTPKAGLPRIVNGDGGGNNNHEEFGGTQKRRQLFSHIELCMDKETAKYMPYASVAFPKLVDASDTSTASDGAGGSSKAEAELENMWMVGFLDHEKRTEKEVALNDLVHFVSLPGGTLLPGAAAQIRKVYNKDRNSLSSAEKRLRKMTAGQKRRILGRTSIAPRLADEHVLRLKELERTKGGLAPLEDRFKKRKHRNKLPWTVYGAENAKIRKALADKNPQRATAVVVKSRALENLFELEREHLQAALCIQECYRTYRMRMFWREIVQKSRAVVVIQRYVRGMITRTLVRVWLLRRSWLIILAQSCIRGVQARKRVRKRFSRESKCATLIQRTVRGYLGRIRADFFASTIAATKIQRLWRGCVARVMTDRMWLDLEVAKVQKVMRGFLGRRKHAKFKAEADAAATLLQRHFRGTLARWEAWALLFDRETERKREYIRILRSEDEWMCEEIKRLEDQRDRVLQLDVALEEASIQAKDMERLVVEKEFDYLCMKQERARCDPLAIRQGWTTELDKFVTEHRQWVTNAKLEYLFVGATFERQIEIEKQEMDAEIARLKFESEHISRVRTEEVEELYQRESQRAWELKRRQRRRTIADQKRRWRVVWYTNDGKIDKKRRVGYAWDPSVFSGDERHVFNVGSVNLLAGTVHEDVSGLELISQQVALQNAQNEMVQHGAMLKPLFDGMEDLTESVVRLSLRTEAARMAQFDEEEGIIDIEEYEEYDD